MEEQTHALDCHIKLTDRDKELLRLISSGYKNKEIAEILKLSHGTVEMYRYKLMIKLDIDNLPGLVKYAVKHGITSVDEKASFKYGKGR